MSPIQTGIKLGGPGRSATEIALGHLKPGIYIPIVPSPKPVRNAPLRKCCKYFAVKIVWAQLLRLTISIGHLGESENEFAS